MYSHAHGSGLGAIAIPAAQRNPTPTDLIVSMENRSEGNARFRQKNDPGVGRQTGKKTGLLSRAQQPSHLEVTHGKRGFLQQPRELGFHHVRGTQLRTLLDNKNFLWSGCCEQFRTSYSSLRPPIRVDQLRFDRPQHAMSLRHGSTELLNLRHVKLLPRRGNSPFVNEMMPDFGSKTRAERTKNMFTENLRRICLYLFSSIE